MRRRRLWESMVFYCDYFVSSVSSLALEESPPHSSFGFSAFNLPLVEAIRSLRGREWCKGRNRHGISFCNCNRCNCNIDSTYYIILSCSKRLSSRCFFLGPQRWREFWAEAHESLQVGNDSDAHDWIGPTSVWPTTKWAHMISLSLSLCAQIQTNYLHKIGGESGFLFFCIIFPNELRFWSYPRPLPLCLVGAHSIGSSWPRGKPRGWWGIFTAWNELVCKCLCYFLTGLFVESRVDSCLHPLIEAHRRHWTLQIRARGILHRECRSLLIWRSGRRFADVIWTVTRYNKMLSDKIEALFDWVCWKVNMFQVLFKGVKPDEYDARKQAWLFLSDSYPSLSKMAEDV